jgi:hypothetical protein
MDKSCLLRILMKKYRGATFALDAALSKPKAFPAPVFVDEFDPGSLQSGSDCCASGARNAARSNRRNCPAISSCSSALLTEKA